MKYKNSWEKMNMPLFGGPCKHIVNYDGRSLDLSGLALTGSEKLKFELGQLKIKRELVQTASEIVQILDAAQYSNCIKIEQTPKDSPERMKLIFQSMESERQLVQFALLTKLLIAQPNSEQLQKGFVDWLASIAPQTKELTSQVAPSTKRALRTPSATTLASSFKRARDAEPQLA
jgi:hypothetical protein